LRRRLWVPNVVSVEPVNPDRLKLALLILDVNEVVYQPDGVIDDNVDSDGATHDALYDSGTYT
jgi:hypothetical protein